MIYYRPLGERIATSATHLVIGLVFGAVGALFVFSLTNVFLRPPFAHIVAIIVFFYIMRYGWDRVVEPFQRPKKSVEELLATAKSERDTYQMMLSLENIPYPKARRDSLQNKLRTVEGDIARLQSVVGYEQT